MLIYDEIFYTTIFPTLNKTPIKYKNLCILQLLFDFLSITATSPPYIFYDKTIKIIIVIQLTYFSPVVANCC